MKKAVSYTFVLLLALSFIIPFLWMVLTSFKTPVEINKIPLSILPESFRFSNYVEAWIKPKSSFTRYFYNTIVISIGGIFLQMFVAIPVAYTITHMKFKYRDLIFLFILATMLIPGDITTIPNFVTIRHIPFAGGNDMFGNGGKGFYDTYAGMILPFIASGFTIFMLRQAFLSIPKDYFESAQLDGVSHFGYMVRILVPLSTSTIITAILLGFIGKWNSLMWPMLISSSENMRPIQVALLNFSSAEGPRTDLIMAAATFTVLPILVLYFFTQKWFHEGIASTGLKG